MYYDLTIPMAGVVTPQATIDKPRPDAGYTPFEHGMITNPATQASTMEVCPGCAVAYGGAQTYSGITTGNYWEAGAGILNIVGGGLGLLF